MIIKPINCDWSEIMVQWNYLWQLEAIFFIINYPIATLTNDNSYLRLFMLNNGTRKIVHDS